MLAAQMQKPYGVKGFNTRPVSFQGTNWHCLLLSLLRFAAFVDYRTGNA
jgi:hypothetical protein